ncbi:Fibronectin type III domain protein [Pseudopedobacter saltans DSM 12145]|uniref:Fibronectin type III domain protein n=1 Tax=Pseudopedobacter saltans (strain ATCC 51119 / DSM 12145 / JCM 21818 / CCUG 39354 / LMG 10337 / NBRC 100064 / NCIMB 13643) TaxID=762903 RepID=F0SE33_PSESL|nr:YDG domain-containing protein [Pseudopedobacter saltans]ADY52959.1 Fibronectin type III domain protein [Pseudopedobacter saltans DSM 12145]
MVKFYKSLFLGVFISLISSSLLHAQITEDFEDESFGVNIKQFSTNGYTYDLTGKFHITEYLKTGYNDSDRFIDNFENCSPSDPSGILGSIKPRLAGYIKVESLWLFGSADCNFVSNDGTATIRGKKSGITQYTISLNSSNLNNIQTVNNGFVFVNFANNNYNNIEIDELEFEVGGNLKYLAIDDFRFSHVSLTQATNVSFTTTQQTQTTLDWTNGTGTSRAVFMKAATTGNPVLIDNTSYTANTIFGSGTQIGSSGWYCVYNGTGSSVTVTGLTSNTTYRAMVVEYNGASGSQKYQGVSGTNNPNNVTTSAVVATPVITTSVTTLSAFSTCSGTASAPQSFTVSGSDLTANLTITAPNGFEISTSSAGTYGSSVSMSPTGGTVSNTTIYIRLRADIIGSPSDNITVSSTGATSKTIAVTGTANIPPATPSASSNSPVAVGNTLNLSTPPVSGATYAWTGPNGFSSNAQNPSITNITAASAGTYSVTVTVTATGCTSAAGTTTVVVNVPSGITPDASGIVRVKQNGAGNKTGDSWANAAAELADALKVAKTNTAIKEIWVAGGTYKPMYSPEDGGNFGTDKGRDNTFLLVKDVKIYGGFAGTENALANRNLSLTANASILSGDIDNNDLPDGTNNTNNAYHVVVSSGDAGTATLNGFTIKGGYANGGGNTITVNGNSIMQNSGAGIYNHLSNLLIEFANISYNVSGGGDGAGVCNISSSPKIVNSLIHHNTGSYRGSGVYNAFSPSMPELINVTITDNVNNPTVGVVHNDGGSAIVKNSIIWSNTAKSGIEGNPSIDVKNSIIQGGYAGTVILNADPQFTNAAAGDYTLSASSPAVNKGSNTSFTGLDANTKDLAGNARVYKYASAGVIDMGAYELQADAATAITAVTVPSNATYAIGQTLNFTIKFSGNVNVTTTGGTPRIVMTIGSTTRYATYTSVSGTGDLVFTYTVQSGDLDTDGIAVGSAIDLNGGTITDGASNAVVLTLNGVGSTTGVLVDGVAPSVTSIVRSSGNPSLTNLSQISFDVTFSELVTGVDASDFTLNTSGGITGASVSSISGSGSVYTVTVSTGTGDGTIRLDFNNSGTGIKDIAGNDIAGGYTAGQSYTVDKTAPIIAGVSNGSSYNVNKTITFNEGTATLNGFAFTSGTTVIAEGSHTLIVTDAAGNSATIAFTIDKTAPIVSGVTNSGLYNTDKTISFNEGTATLNGSTFTSGSVVSAEGTYTLVVTDAAGNSTTVSFTIDKTPPTTTVATLALSDDSGVSSTDFITNVAAQTLSGTLSANLQTGETVHISLDNGATYQLATATVGLNTFSLSGVTLSGSSTINVHVADQAGNKGMEYSQAYTLDTTPPTAPSTPGLTAASDSGVSDSDHITNVTQPTFTGTAEAGATITLYSGATVLGTTTATGGNWSITLASALTDGAYSITAKATDIAGNVSSASSAIAITIDTTKPSVAITSSVSTLKKDETATITFTFSEDPGSSFTSADIIISGGTLSALSGTGTTRTATFTPTANVDEGTVSITIAAGSYTDIAGNTGLAGTTPSLTYDTKAPAVPTGLTAIFDNQQSVLNWTANTETDLSSYKIYSGTSANPTTLLATVTKPTVTYTDTGLTNGTTYYYRITAVDQAGNESTYSTEVTAIPEAAQTITFNALTAKTYGDADFDAGAATTSGLTISYNSDNTSVATIVSGKIHIVGAGTANITASQSGDNFYKAAADQVHTLTVNKKILTATSQAVSKTYDGTLTAAINFNAFTTATGLVGTDDVFVTYSSASYDDKHVGVNKAVTINNLALSGTSKNNYSLNVFSTTGSIITKTINVTAQADSRVYNGTTTSSVAPVVSALQTGDVISVQPIQIYNNRNVGSNKTLIPSGLIINDGNNGANYTVNYVNNTSGEITKKAINVTAQADSRVYNGTTTSFITPVTDALQTGDVITVQPVQIYDNRNVGLNKTLIPSGLVINDGNNGANYTVSYVNNTSGEITGKALVITATANNKIYDGNTNATVSLSDNRVSGDVLTLAHTTATFNNKNIGNNKPVSISGISISGADAANYTFNTEASTTANITAKALTISATATDKVYDGNTNATVSLSDNRVTGDVLTLANTAATFDNKNVGANKAVSVSGISISGSDAVNYTFNNTAATTANVTPAKLSYVASPVTKVYGDANPLLTGTVTGFVTGDTQANATTGTLSFSTAASNASGIGSYAITGSGLSAQNYTLEQAAGNAAALTVTARPVTIKADAKAKIYGDNDPALTYQITTGNLVNGDTFTGALQRDNGQNAGSYAIKQGTVALSNNYNLSYQPANLVINKALLTVAANNSSRCYGTNNPAFSVSYSGFKYSDNENSLTSRPTVSTMANTGSVAGNYELVPSGGVSANYDFSYVKGTLTVNPLPINTIVSDKGTSISKGETAVLTVSSNNGTSYSWTTANGIISGQNSAVLTVRPMETTTYTVTVRNANGCESVSTITIAVREDYMAVQAENFLTPNGDGVNDNWVIKNIDAYPDHTLSIYDRSGKELYKVRNYKNDWDGTFNGMPLAEGTYYYIIRFDQNQPSLKMAKGFITIVRSK